MGQSGTAICLLSQISKEPTAQRGGVSVPVARADAEELGQAAGLKVLIHAVNRQRSEMCGVALLARLGQNSTHGDVVRLRKYRADTR